MIWVLLGYWSFGCLTAVLMFTLEETPRYTEAKLQRLMDAPLVVVLVICFWPVLLLLMVAALLAPLDRQRR